MGGGVNAAATAECTHTIQKARDDAVVSGLRASIAQMHMCALAIEPALKLLVISVRV